MKNREKIIITKLLMERKINFDVLKEELCVSRRTLYYDIDNLNELLEGIGTIIISHKEIKLSGNYTEIHKIVNHDDLENYDRFLKYENRKSYILEKILNGFVVKSSALSSSMYISNVTIKDTIRRMKEELLAKGIYLTYQHGYQLKGDEGKIRELFLETYFDSSRKITISSSVNSFDKKSSLRLTDYSKNSLTSFVNFVSIRINKGLVIGDVLLYEEVEEFKHFKEISTLYEMEVPHNEKIYMSAYVSSLSCLNELVLKKEIEEIVDTLIDNIEKNLLIYFRNKEECKKHMLRHIASSFYRIKYKFPIRNPLLEEIKYKYKSLFLMTKNIFNSGKLTDHLKGIRDEEVAFIVSYLGAYIFKDDAANSEIFKVLIACPNGITVSKTIQYQLERHFPQLEVIDTISTTEVQEYRKDYDFVISTIQLNGIKNNIVVNPLLRNFDLDTISKVIYNTTRGLNEINIEDLMEVINKYSTIKDEKSLKKVLYNVIYEKNIQKGVSLMLSDVLVESRIKFTDQCKNWESAIRQASLPLLEQGAIEEEYINAMIESVHSNGPYIVLDEYFALAHARPNQGVNKVAMSLLTIKEPVDFLGKEVKVIVVLAATDNKKHLKALASLTELLMVEGNLEKIMNAESVDSIINLIQQYS
jgi:transcriptional antiterminator/mannitol/fructose-specific phosphotransferase system IIA component (Ntr-type)